MHIRKAKTGQSAPRSVGRPCSGAVTARALRSLGERPETSPGSGDLAFVAHWSAKDASTSANHLFICSTPSPRSALVLRIGRDRSVLSNGIDLRTEPVRRDCTVWRIVGTVAHDGAGATERVRKPVMRPRSRLRLSDDRRPSAESSSPLGPNRFEASAEKRDRSARRFRSWIRASETDRRGA